MMALNQLENLLVSGVSRHPALDSTQWFLLGKQPVQAYPVLATIGLLGRTLDLRYRSWNLPDRPGSAQAPYGRSFLTLSRSARATGNISSYWRAARAERFRRRWLLPCFVRVSFPEPVSEKRCAVPLWVFSLGIRNSPIRNVTRWQESSIACGAVAGQTAYSSPGSEALGAGRAQSDPPQGYR